jgi:hypothetical protein
MALLVLYSYHEAKKLGLLQVVPSDEGARLHHFGGELLCLLKKRLHGIQVVLFASQPQIRSIIFNVKGDEFSKVRR